MRPAPRQDVRSDRGFTLLELLVVIGIISLLMGLGVAGYMGLRRNLEGEGALSGLESTLRTARHTALFSSTFSQVRIDTKQKAVYAIGFKMLGMWHFEDAKFTGAFGVDASVEGGERDPAGKIGSGVLLNDVRGAHVQLGKKYDFKQGGHVEAFFYPLQLGNDQTLFAKGSHLGLRLDKEGILQARVRKASCNSGSYALPSHRWSKVAVQWITRGQGADALTEITILVNDIERGRGSGDGAVTSKKVLTLSDPKMHFYGLVDEARVLGAVQSTPWTWPDDMSTKLLGQDVTVIYFDQQGHLDPRHHGGPVTLAFVHDGKTVYRVRIGMVGTIQSISKRKFDPQAIEQELKAKKKKKKTTPKRKSKRTGNRGRR